MKNAFLLFTLFCSFQVQAGEGGGHVGGGGDVRRYRSQVAIRELGTKIERYSLFACESPRNITERAFQDMTGWDWFHELQEGKYVWINESQGECLRIRTEYGVTSRQTIFQFSYLDCPYFADDPMYYPDLLLRAIYNESFLDEVSEATFMTQARRIRDVLARSDCDEAATPTELPQDHVTIDFEDRVAITEMMEQGRRDAIRITNTLNPIIYRTNMIGDTYTVPFQWFIEHKSRLIDELENSPIIFDDNNASCGFTESAPHSPIIFSFSNCKEFRGARDAQWLLFHEVMHHMGIEDEMRADSLADKILQVFYSPFPDSNDEE